MLAGLRVVDLAGEALTYAGRMFADLGADVILVEPPGGSTARTIPPLVTDEEGSCSAHFAFMAAGKRSLALDVDVPRGRSVLEQLLRASDVVLVPGDVDEQRARRLDPVTLRELDPRLVVTSATGFGTTGPRRHWRSSDIVGWATSGAMYGIGDPDRPPVAPGGGLGTTAGALNAAMGTMLALRSRRRRGAGQLVDVSLQEAVLSVSMEAGPLLTMEGAVQQRAGRRRMAAHGNFPVQDGTVEIVAFLPTQWDAMAEWIRDELGAEEAMMDEFRGGSASRVHFAELIEGWVLELCSRYTRQEFFAEAQRRRVPCGPVNSPADLLTDPQLEAVGAWVEVAHPDVGAVRLPRSPVRFDGVALPVGPVPAPGEHGVAVLREVVGLTDDQIATLLDEGVLAAGISPRSA
jgi:crotonobetainyl-CoA:carnitine CoA-transferase CaiB-like acyl-CoA transferase